MTTTVSRGRKVWFRTDVTAATRLDHRSSVCEQITTVTSVGGGDMSSQPRFGGRRETCDRAAATARRGLRPPLPRDRRYDPPTVSDRPQATFTVHPPGFEARYLCDPHPRAQGAH